MAAVIAPLASALGLGPVGTALFQIGASLLLSAGANALMSGGRDQKTDTRIDLSLPTELPAYRFVYGHTLAVGTPAPIRVREDKIIGCWILNSRGSAMTNLKVFLDKREVEYTGDPLVLLDGAGYGATATNEPFVDHVKFWISRGGEIEPPVEIQNDFPWAAGEDEELFKESDGWRGRTVIWMVLTAGDEDKVEERWPNGAPLVEVEADYTRIWDPREGGSSDVFAIDYSNNHALICLDAMMNNPIKPYQERNILIDQFIEAADVSDELVALKAGGTERRYTVAGTVVWAEKELWQHLTPLYSAGAARPTTIGGRRGIAPGQWEAPSYTLTDFLLETPEVVGTDPGDLPTQLVSEYRNPLRLFEPAELDPYDIPDAQTDDGGVARVMNLDLKYAGSPTQAMRVQKIEGGLLRQQKKISLIAPPGAADLVGGAVLTCDLAAPWNRLDGTYRVEMIDPTNVVGEDGGVAMRCPLVARLHSDSVYAWDEATDEQDIVDVVFNEEADGVTVTLPEPTLDSAAESGTTAGDIIVAYETPNDARMNELVIEMSEGSSPFIVIATRRFSASPNVRYQRKFTVGGGVTRHFRARVEGNFGSASPNTTPVSVTTA